MIDIVRQPRVWLGYRHANGHANTTPAEQSVVTLFEVAQLYTRLSPHPHTGLQHAEDRKTFEHQLLRFRDQCNRANGARPPAEIKDSFFCSSLPAGVVLMGEPTNRLYATFPPSARAPAWITEQLIKALLLYIDIREILRRRNRVICLEMVFTCIVQLLRLMGNEDWRLMELERHQPPQPSPCDPSRLEWELEPWPALRRLYESELRQGEDLVRRAAQRQAQLDYFKGMLLGAVILAGALYALVQTLTGWPSDQFGMAPQLTPVLWLCPLVGGIGAIVSVMQRMSSGDCALRDRTGWLALVLVGAFRPLIGAVFASVIVAMVTARLVPVQFDAAPGEPPPYVLYAVLAFFGGFSERFAQDMLGAGKGQLTNGTPEERRAAAT